MSGTLYLGTQQVGSYYHDDSRCAPNDARRSLGGLHLAHGESQLLSQAVFG
jgi:hypothetical protein